MAIKTRLFSDSDLDEALSLLEEFCEEEDIDAEDIISVNIVSKNADKDSSVVLVYDDCTTDD